MTAEKTVAKSLRIPESLWKQIENLHKELPTGWQSPHDLMLGLLREGLAARRVGTTKEQVSHLASQLENLLKGK